MKRNLIEPVLGFCLLGIVILAVKYGSIHVTGSTDAYIKEMPVVVIDAGHGGTDPGKVGVDGSLEKDINLAVAKRLKTYLEQDDIRVIMTRETDTGLYSDTDRSLKRAARILWSASIRTVIMKNPCPAARYFITGIQQKAKRWRKSCRKGSAMSLENRTGDFRRQMAIIIFFCM